MNGLRSRLVIVPKTFAMFMVLALAAFGLVTVPAQAASAPIKSVRAMTANPALMAKAVVININDPAQSAPMTGIPAYYTDVTIYDVATAEEATEIAATVDPDTELFVLVAYGQDVKGLSDASGQIVAARPDGVLTQYVFVRDIRNENGLLARAGVVEPTKPVAGYEYNSSFSATYRLQYDGLVDFPSNPYAVLANLNALVGAVTTTKADYENWEQEGTLEDEVHNFVVTQDSYGNFDVLLLRRAPLLTLVDSVPFVGKPVSTIIEPALNRSLAAANTTESLNDAVERWKQLPNDLSQGLNNLQEANTPPPAPATVPVEPDGDDVSPLSARSSSEKPAVQTSIVRDSLKVKPGQTFSDIRKDARERSAQISSDLNDASKKVRQDIKRAGERLTSSVNRAVDRVTSSLPKPKPHRGSAGTNNGDGNGGGDNGGDSKSGGDS